MVGPGGICDMGARTLLVEEALCTLRGELDAAIWILLDMVGLRCNCCAFRACAKRAELIPDDDMLPRLLLPLTLTPFAAASKCACPTCRCCCDNSACRPGNPLSVR